MSRGGSLRHGSYDMNFVLFTQRFRQGAQTYGFYAVVVGNEYPHTGCTLSLSSNTDISTPCLRA